VTLGRPPRHPTVALGALLTGLTVSLLAVSATADVTKEQCVDANGQGQQLRREGKLAAAREQLRLCMKPKCPAIVRDDCTKRLDELEKAQPTIAFTAKDASGADITAIKVTVDDQPLASKLDGTALPVDVGEHTFTFEAPGEPVVTRKLVLTEGEKGRREAITIGQAAPPPVPARAPIETAAAPAPANDAGGPGARKVVGLSVGGAGVVALGVGAAFGFMAISKKNQQTTDCPDAATCTTDGHSRALDDHSSGMTDSTLSTVGFIAGGALLVGGAILFFTGGHGAGAAESSAFQVAPSVGPGSGGMLVRGAF
jgi:hypothetical protein